MNNFRKYLSLSLVVALLNAILLLFFFVPRFEHTDTREYVATIRYLAGEPGGEIVYHRILKPLPLLISAIFYPILGAENSLIFQNIVFYFLSVWLIFLLVYSLYGNEKQAFYGTVLYVGAYPMLAYGLAALTDLSGWFFYLCSVLIALNFLKRPRVKMALLSGLVAGVGMLFKESLVAAPIFFVSLVFIATKFPFGDKLKYVLLFGAAFILPNLINNIILYQLYSFSLWDWYKRVGANDGFYAYSALRTFIEIGRVFLIGWIFVLLGILKELSHRNIIRMKTLLAFLPASLSFLLWPFPHNRIAYITAPLLVLLGSFGLLRTGKNPKMYKVTELALLFLYCSVNYAILEFLLRYGVFFKDKF